MSGHSHDNMAPPGALALAGALVGLSLLLVLGVRFDWLAPSPTAASLRSDAGVAPVAERLLRFSDRSDGAVVVEDAVSATTVAVIGREGSGFIRGVMRGLARERRMHGAGQQPPFRLTAWNDGALSLVDTATGRVIELNGFGPTNRAAFARLLTADGAR